MRTRVRRTNTHTWKHERAENIHVYFGVAYEIAPLCFFYLQLSCFRVEQGETN